LRAIPASARWRAAIRSSPLRVHTREELLTTIEKNLQKINARVDDAKLAGAHEIALRVGKVINQYKVAKHFELDVAEAAFTFARRHDSIGAEAAHRTADRVRAQIFLCMLAYYVEWRMREALRDLMFADTDQQTKATPDPVAPAARLTPGPAHRLSPSSPRPTQSKSAHSSCCTRSSFGQNPETRNSASMPKYQSASETRSALTRTQTNPSSASRSTNGLRCVVFSSEQSAR
jgi:hypothetical protein